MSYNVRVLNMRALPLILLTAPFASAQVSKVWVSDQGDGAYRNPILYADYSDPDVVRVGADFYMTASSFDAVPGLPILHSNDLVSWKLIGHALPVQPPVDVYRNTQHGNGVWAPAIRYHAGEFYIYYPDPEYGIYMVKAKDAAGPWSEPLLIKRARGWIDPCPLWDDDGRAYLVNAFAASRSGIKSTLIVSRLSPDGKSLLDGGTIVFDGHPQDPTVEGPKFYKRNGYYYIAAPAGGVPTGWQLVLRSRNVYGPYERRVVLSQGNSPVNGPHQGGWVDTPDGGEYWFVHFQDAGAYGRIVRLEPVQWVDNWPVMGDNGTPVLTHGKPRVGKTYPTATPPDTDEFNGDQIGLQWQWQADPEPGWAFPSSALGVLRLICTRPPEGFRNLWDVPDILLQKFPAPTFTVTTKVTFHAMSDGEKTGLVILGSDYAYLAVQKKGQELSVIQAAAKNADRGAAEHEVASVPANGATVYLRVSVGEGAVCRFSFSRDGAAFDNIGEPFTAKPGRWIGAKVGLFALGTGQTGESGYADYDWFRIE